MHMLSNWSGGKTFVYPVINGPCHYKAWYRAGSTVLFCLLSYISIVSYEWNNYTYTA
ncbi:hypothetical protein BU24DRAFT_428854 [Aaosphaeria arxii CBS 175.79]|uniref:Uncharacterized protein n=1 Tax=Aaosphaeria arxii CBS 175.79 TaxID=1450172 RepID=A0A6A5X983_9PLEO|nr:uncharacterized protein BU24DRAFT_428854 [Aaosphaeria arxii CBS 175.79]KAF2009317.1 hypothetical protein BU24DRAFT_428854 [Aaosphaeria arxii CBS 175.79]